MGDEELDYALDLMRRLPPSHTEENLAGLIDLVPDLVEDLLSAVDQPLKIAYDSESKRDYLLCDYNRDGDSYRSPWSNKYDPPLKDGNTPSKELRDTEIAANQAFDIYREMYYEGGVSSVYLWDVDGGFAGVILVKRTQDLAKGTGEPMKGTWDSIHVFEVEDKNGGTADYKVTSTVMLTIETQNDKTGAVNLSGSLTRQESREGQPVNKEKTHIANVGSLVEDMENKMRTSLNTIYFGKTKDIVNDLRKKQGVKFAASSAAMQKDLMAGAAQKKGPK